MKDKLRCADLYGKTEQTFDSDEGPITYHIGHIGMGDNERQRVVARKIPCRRGEKRLSGVRDSTYFS